MYRGAQLLAIRIGPGAAVLPKDVKRIHMQFAPKLNDGHMGPRKFWQHYLPRLKYHNPAIPMTVDRTQTQSGLATLTIFFTQPTTSSDSTTPLPAPTSSTSGDTAPSASYAPTERTVSINMKHRTDAEILTQFMEATKATVVEATPEELEEMRELEEQGARSQRDSARSMEVNKQRKREADMLAQARGYIAAQAT
ncbi:hypothetical protein B0A49_03114 [Cryomyces minteri]|uniref:Ribosomal protein/NADH dehydrogenase domain-containing protein n=1 Tax=Cryomyces minteri TaxID=331657 RepID=A0A4U0X2U1_9PEZI|nr:hypothetical protein B0A49_03114 [Cryomyces minteri]